LLAAVFPLLAYCSRAILRIGGVEGCLFSENRESFSYYIESNFAFFLKASISGFSLASSENSEC